MTSSEHPTQQGPEEQLDPARMGAQTARLMASDMASLAGAMFRLLQQPTTAERTAEPTRAAAAPPTTPTTPTTPPPAAPAVPVPALAVPGLDLQPPTPAAPPAEPTRDIAVPALAVPSLAVPGIVLSSDDAGPTEFDFDLDPEPEPEAHEESETAQQPAAPDSEEPDGTSPRSRALLDEIAFLDD